MQGQGSVSGASYDKLLTEKSENALLSDVDERTVSDNSIYHQFDVIGYFFLFILLSLTIIGLIVSKNTRTKGF